AAGGRLVAHDQINAKQPKREPNPLYEPHALPQPAIGDRRGQRWLQAEDEGNHSSRHPVLDRDEYAAETEAMHQKAGDRAVRHPARARPFRPREREDRAKQHPARAHAQRQERQRFGVSKPKLGADKASSPQHDEYAGRREYDEVLQTARHERGHPNCPMPGPILGSRITATRDTNQGYRHRIASSERTGRGWAVRTTNVRLGSDADIEASLMDVRFTPKADIS